MIAEICDQFMTAVAAADAPARHVVNPYDAAASTQAEHQFTVFLKPEATAVDKGVDIAKILEMVHERFAAFDVTIGATLILNGPYLEKYNLMGQHYGVINAISRGGPDAISADAKAKLQDGFGELIEGGAPVLGGHQFIAANPDFSPLALSTINDNIGTSKLAGGTYLLKFDLHGLPQLVINPFHPYQLVPFTDPGKAIIIMEGLSSRPWKDLRGELTGTTNPATAPADSIRGRLLANKDDFGLAAVNQGSNGIHLSAGPLEGMAEVQRFFSDHDAGAPLAFADTAFGARLTAAGISPERVTELADNPDIGDESAFDLTEEVCAADALSKLV